jgi:hypothetical protein
MRGRKNEESSLSREWGRSWRPLSIGLNGVRPRDENRLNCGSGNGKSAEAYFSDPLFQSQPVPSRAGRFDIEGRFALPFAHAGVVPVCGWENG